MNTPRALALFKGLVNGDGATGSDLAEAAGILLGYVKTLETHNARLRKERNDAREETEHFKDRFRRYLKARQAEREDVTR